MVRWWRLCFHFCLDSINKLACRCLCALSFGHRVGDAERIVVNIPFNDFVYGGENWNWPVIVDVVFWLALADRNDPSNLQSPCILDRLKSLIFFRFCFNIRHFCTNQTLMQTSVTQWLLQLIKIRRHFHCHCTSSNRKIVFFDLLMISLYRACCLIFCFCWWFQRLDQRRMQC